MSVLNLLHNIITKMMKFLCTFIFMGLILLVAAQVVVRFTLNNLVDMSWSEELVRYALCWMVFCGTAAVYEQHGHAWVTNLVDAVPEKLRTVMLVISYIFQLIFFIATLIGATEYIPTISAQTSAVLHIPLPIVYIIIPICAVVSLLFCIRDIVQLLWKKGDLRA